MDGPPDYTLVGQARRLEVLAAIRRLRCEIDAAETALLAAMATDLDPYRDGGDVTKGWVREDVACTLRIPSQTAGDKLRFAVEMASRYPATLAAMRAGAFDGRYAQRLVEAAIDLPDAAATTVEKRVLDRAGSQTLAQFGASVRRAVASADTRAAEQKHAAARVQRRVVFTPTEHGMTELWALLPAEQAAVLQAHVQAVADQDKGIDERTADQRRADALCTLGGQTARGAAGSGANVNVTVALSTLLGLDDQPGDLDGHGPVPAGLVRRIAFERGSRWRRLVTDPRGQVADAGSRTHRPPANMNRFVRLRDRTCRFPGCRRRSVFTETDHILDWARGGATTAENLACLCARHHHLKHDGRWTYLLHPDGAVTWTHPLGPRWTRPPPDPVP